nr:unnamed protein product [Digitaria exilis]
MSDADEPRRGQEVEASLSPGESQKVSIKSEDDKVVDGKGIGRKVIDKLLQTYSSELDGKDFAYDGEKCLFTVGPLPQNNFEFTVIMEETSSRGCLLVRQSFFSDDSRNLVDLTGGVSGCRGLHSSFRTTIGGLSLNMDVSTTMIVTPGPVIDFLLTNQNVRDIRDIDWPRAKKMLKNLRVKAKHNNMEFKIIGLSDQACSKQTFPMKVRNGSIEVQTVDITVQDYFKSKQVELTMPYLPCLDVGKPKRPNYLPIELVVGNSEDCIPNRGRWNYNNKRLLDPVKIERWAIVNFSARCDMSRISRELINCGRSKGIFIERPYTLVDEDSQSRRCLPVERVERMFEKVKMSLPGPPEFLLCVLPERKNCDIYGPWKKKNLHEEGIVTQCIAPSNKMNDQYFTNVLLKINAKLGGMNSKLALEHRQMIPVVTQVVGSRCWPLISRYRASVRTQSPKVEMIDSLFKPLDDGKDDGIMR